MMRDAGPPGLNSPSSPFGYREVRPLLDALRDPVQAVRTGALRALVRLPLREEVWLDVGDFFWQELAPPVGDDGPEPRVEPAVPRHELIEAAIYVPVAAIRQQLHELVERGAEEERRLTAYALARAHDAAAIPQLVADLSSPDTDRRALAAEHLSLLDVTPVRERLHHICLEDADGDVRFWLALALARLGDAEGIGSVLLDFGRGTIDIPLLLWGDPVPLTDRVADRGPFPDAVNDLLRQIATDESADGYDVRQVANDLLSVSAQARPGGPAGEEWDASTASEGAAEQAGDPALRQRAAELATAYAAQSPFDDQTSGLPWEETQILAHLPPLSATSLVSALFAHLVRQFPPGERMGAGNAIMQLPLAMWRSFVPDVEALLDFYLALDERDAHLRWQLAWAMSRAGLRRLLAELTLRLAVADEAERTAVVCLIEQAILCSRFSHGPIFGGPSAPADVPPAVEPLIDLEWHEAAREAAHEAAAYEEEVEEEHERRLTLEPAPKGLEPEAEPGPEPRWLQGQLFELDEGRAVRLGRALRAGALHRLVVRIGAADEEWITAPEDEAIPIEELPEDQDEYELHITFSEPNHVPQPLTDTIYLPRLRGNSTTCEFQFRTRSDVPVFEGRVVVRYGGNRILQTMFLVAQVLPDPAQAPPELAIKLQPETPVRATLAALESQRPFDVALVADTGSDGVTHVTEMAGERVELRSLENVEAFMQRIYRRLSRVADMPEDFPRDLDAAATVELLRFLARQGKLLYSGIVEGQIGDHPLRTASRIQLVSARESFLPLEFLYDRPAPTADATLCPNAREALETGTCAHCDEIDAEAASAYVCPLGFWCMNRVIERHAVKPVAETNLSGTEYALQSDPIAGRDALDVLRAAVYAASNRVQEEQIEDLLETLADVTGHRVERVQDWDTWRDAVQNRSPSLLVLVPHTLEDADYIPTLEIGEEQRLPAIQITEGHVHAARDYVPPIVLLLGCETAMPDVPFQGFAALFRKRGAAIVLSTLTPVLGRHAVPVAQVVLSELARVACARGTFGDALLGVRRRALAAGIPMVLSLVAYGDADWRFHGDATGGVPADGP